MPLSYIDSHSHGDMVSRIIADVDTFSEGLLMGFTQLFTGIATIAGTLIFMLTIDVKISCIVVLITPLSLLWQALSLKRLIPCSSYRQEQGESRQHSSMR